MRLHKRRRADSQEKAGPPGKRVNRMHPASFLTGACVASPEGQDLGSVEEIMIDEVSGAIAYAVLSFDPFMRMGDSLFAVPWKALTYDGEKKKLILNVTLETLEEAPGFARRDWPDMADPDWGKVIYHYYGHRPFWE